MQSISIAVNSALKPYLIFDKVKTFSDACNLLGIKGDVMKANVNDDLLNDAASISAYVQLIIITRALNEGWQPDWTDSSQYKYLPWFKHKSGFGLSFGDAVIWFTTTFVCSRLCFKSRELAEYAAKQFADLYNDYLTIK
jgi:hypothetical protein